MSQLSQQNPPPPENGARLVTPRTLIVLFVTAVLVTIAFAGWTDIYSQYLEIEKPLIRLVEAPRGIGLAPVGMKFELLDSGSGLHQVIIRTRQRDKVREILKKDLQGLNSAKVSVEFPGEKSSLEEGPVELEVRVVDRALWKNSRVEYYSLKVDFSKPNVEIFSTQHNARHGGSQLVFYRARDEDLAISGVKVGGHTFIGFPARGIDRELDDPSLYVALYAVDLRTDVRDLPIRVFAEDQVGNATSVTFDNMVDVTAQKNVNVEIGEEVMRSAIANLADQNFQKIRDELKKVGEDFEYQTSKNSKERTVEKFKMVNETLRSFNDLEVMSLLKGPRFESYWNRAFLEPNGVWQLGFGDQISYRYQGQEIGKYTELGYEFIPPRDDREVLAANDGIVIFSENIGVYGRCLAIDHGLGLVTFYGNLEQVVVNKGVAVTRGQKIGLAGTSGFARNVELYFETRVHGVPVNPAEWWDEGWFYAQITSKINEVKHKLGIPVYRPLR